MAQRARSWSPRAAAAPAAREIRCSDRNFLERILAGFEHQCPDRTRHRQARRCMWCSTAELKCWGARARHVQRVPCPVRPTHRCRSSAARAPGGRAAVQHAHRCGSSARTAPRLQPAVQGLHNSGSSACSAQCVRHRCVVVHRSLSSARTAPRRHWLCRVRTNGHQCIACTLLLDSCASLMHSCDRTCECPI